jgi:hypothetical protein
MLYLSLRYSNIFFGKRQAAEFPLIKRNLLYSKILPGAKPFCEYFSSFWGDIWGEFKKPARPAIFFANFLKFLRRGLEKENKGWKNPTRMLKGIYKEVRGHVSGYQS